MSERGAWLESLKSNTNFYKNETGKKSWMFFLIPTISNKNLLKNFAQTKQPIAGHNMTTTLSRTPKPWLRKRLANWQHAVASRRLNLQARQTFTFGVTSRQKYLTRRSIFWTWSHQESTTCHVWFQLSTVCRMWLWCFQPLQRKSHMFIKNAPTTVLYSHAMATIWSNIKFNNYS